MPHFYALPIVNPSVSENVQSHQLPSQNISAFQSYFYRKYSETPSTSSSQNMNDNY